MGFFILLSFTSSKEDFLLHGHLKRKEKRNIYRVVCNGQSFSQRIRCLWVQNVLEVTQWMKESAVFGGEGPRNSRRSERQSESKTSAVMGFMSRPGFSLVKLSKEGKIRVSIVGVCCCTHIWAKCGRGESTSIPIFITCTKHLTITSYVLLLNYYIRVDFLPVMDCFMHYNFRSY